MFQRIKRAITGAVLATSAAVASATPATTFDAAPYASDVSATIPGMLAIGGAVFLVVLAIKSTKWGRRAL